MLQSLSCLEFSNIASEASFQFDWKALTSLAHLHIVGPANFDQRLEDLAVVSSLKSVCLHEMASTSAQTIVIVETLAHRLGVERPEVQLSLCK